MNVVMLRRFATPGSTLINEAEFVEVQGTAEGAPFRRSVLDAMLGLASDSLAEIMELQSELIASPPRNARPSDSVTELRLRLGQPATRLPRSQRCSTG